MEFIFWNQFSDSRDLMKGLSIIIWKISEEKYHCVLVFKKPLISQ